MVSIITGSTPQHLDRLNAISKNNYGVVYKATNTANGMIYIGQTRQRLITTRISQHISDAEIRKGRSKSHFMNAIIKYGAKSFHWDILDMAVTAEELNEKEKYWIQFCRSTNNKIGYNKTTGGDSFERTEDTCHKLSLAMKANGNKYHNGAKTSASLKRYYETHKSPTLGMVVSEETRRKLSKFNAGKTLSEEHKIKIGKAHKGRKFSEMHKERVGIASAQRWKNYSPERKAELVKRMRKDGPWNKGIGCSAETRGKIRASNLKNGNKYNQPYYTRDNVIEKIAPLTLEQLKEFIAQGTSNKQIGNMHNIHPNEISLICRIFKLRCKSRRTPEIPKEELEHHVDNKMSYAAIAKKYGVEGQLIFEYCMIYDIRYPS